MQYPPYVRIIEVPCTGKVDIMHLLMAFEYGADGVIVVGCMEGDCHYSTGNYKARRRMALLNKVLPQLGIEPERLRLEWISASEGAKFQSTVNEFIEEIRALGSLTEKKEEKEVQLEGAKR